MNHWIRFAAALVAFAIPACTRPTCGHEDLVYDETANLCICRPGTVEQDGACVPVDAGTAPSDSGIPNDDAGRPDDGDAGTPTDAGACPGCECNPGEVRPCPEGSSVGECSAGEQACGTDGFWSVCLGARGPGEETCDGRDEDCDGRVDEELGALGSPTTIDAFSSPDWEYRVVPIAALRGVNGETIAVWRATQSQTGGEYVSVFAQRVSAAGTPIGPRVTVVSPGPFDERVAAYSTATELVVVAAFQEDAFVPANIRMMRFALVDLEEIEAQTVRRLSGTSFPQEIAASPLDSGNAVVAIRMSGSGQTYVFASPTDPLPSMPATGALGEPITTDGGEVDLWYDRTTTTPWIAYTDGPNVRVARIMPDGVLAASAVVENAEQPVLRGSDGTLGLAYLDTERNARFLSLSAADPPVRGAGLDLGPVWTTAGRRTLAMTAYDTRREWLVSMIREYGAFYRVTFHQVVPSGSGYASAEIPALVGAGGLASSRSSERSALTLVGGSTLQAVTYGCP